MIHPSIKTLFILSGFLTLSLASATNKSKECAARLAEDRIHLSGQQTVPNFDFLKQNLDAIYSPGGIADQLGLYNPDRHIVHFVASAEISHLLGNGHHALGEPYSGAAILASAQNDEGVLEFVPFTKEGVDRSVYRDDMTEGELISIFAHVAGHLHFNHHTRFRQMQQVDSFEESYNLFKYIENLKSRVPTDQIYQWVRYCYTFAFGQDLAVGQHDSVTELTPKDQTRAHLEDGPPPPPRRTPSILQHLNAHLPPTTPKWKRDILLRIERLSRYRSGAAVTKIANEGFAMQVQSMLFTHLPEKSFALYQEWKELFQKVLVPSPRNPYWLGMEVLERIRKRFQEKPDIRDLPQIEKDRLYIAYVTKEFIQNYDQFDFVMRGLDDEWIHKHRLAIIRPFDWAKDGDYPNLGDPEDPKNYYPWKIVSRDAKKVIRLLTEKLADNRRIFPRPLIDPKSVGTGVQRLVFHQDDPFGNTIPLKTPSLVKTLYIYAQGYQKPVELECMVSHKFSSGSWWWRDSSVQIAKAIVRVSPKGQLFVSLSGQSDGEFSLEGFREKSQEILHEYRRVEGRGLSNDSQKEMGWRKPKHLNQAIEIASSDAVNAIPTQLLYRPTSPTWATALAAYDRFLQEQLLSAITDALRGTGSFTRRGSGIQIRALQEIPHFEFDNKTLAQAKRSDDDDFTLGISRQEWEDLAENDKRQGPFVLPNGKTVSPSLIQAFGSEMAAVSFLPQEKIGGVEGNEGDWIWGPDPNEDEGDDDGDGDGDGDGDVDFGDGDEDEEEADDDENGNPPGDGAIEPGLVNISLETYADILASRVELPRLKPKGGEIENQSFVRAGKVKHPSGPLIVPDTAQNVMARGIGSIAADNAREGKDIFDGLDPITAMFRGAALLRPQDLVVKHEDVDPEPDYNAIIIFTVDFSGSMMGERLQIAKQLIYDLRALLLRKYPRVECRFIAFDSNAHVYKSADKFFRLRLGGGTSYENGLRKTSEVLDGFPPSRWDRYVVGTGDLEDFGRDSLDAVVKEVYGKTEYMGMVNSSLSHGDNWLGEYFKGLAEQEEFFGYANIPSSGYDVSIFDELFKIEAN